MRELLATGVSSALFSGGHKGGGIPVFPSCRCKMNNTEALLRPAMALCPFLSQLRTDFDGTESDNCQRFPTCPAWHISPSTGGTVAMF